MPLLHELAAFEWAVRHTVDGADVAPFTLDDLLAVPAEAWPALQPRPQPAATLLALDWHTPFVWQALVEQAQPVEPDPGPPSPRMLAVPRSRVLMTEP